jgi:tetratricopeptide (TPR) repeat protein
VEPAAAAPAAPTPSRSSADPGRALEAAPDRSWLAAAIVLGVAAPAVQWMLLSSDLERGLARVHAFTYEAPRRTDDELARTWDYLGIRYIKLQRWSEGARVLEQAARIGPSPRILRQWATCEARLGHLKEAHALCGRALAGNPEDYPGWREYAASSMLLGERGEARRAAHEMLRLEPGDPDAMRVLRELGAPGPADSAAGGS